MNVNYQPSTSATPKKKSASAHGKRKQTKELQKRGGRENDPGRTTRKSRQNKFETLGSSVQNTTEKRATSSTGGIAEME